MEVKSHSHLAASRKSEKWDFRREKKRWVRRSWAPAGSRKNRPHTWGISACGMFVGWHEVLFLIFWCTFLSFLIQNEPPSAQTLFRLPLLVFPKSNHYYKVCGNTRAGLPQVFWMWNHCLNPAYKAWKGSCHPVCHSRFFKFLQPFYPLNPLQSSVSAVNCCDGSGCWASEFSSE